MYYKFGDVNTMHQTFVIIGIFTAYFCMYVILVSVCVCVCVRVCILVCKNEFYMYVFTFGQ